MGGEVMGVVEPWSMARWKARMDFLLTVIELLFSISYRRRQNVSKLTAFWRGWVSLSQDFRGSGPPSGIFFGF